MCNSKELWEESEGNLGHLHVPRIINEPIKPGQELVLDMSSDSQRPPHKTEALQTDSQAGLHARIGSASTALQQRLSPLASTVLPCNLCSCALGSEASSGTRDLEPVRIQERKLTS